MRRALLALPVLIVVLAATACSTNGNGSDGADATSSTTTAPVDLPPVGGDPDDQVVWQESTAGGFVPTQASAVQVPEATIYADGRIFLATPDEQSRFDHPARVTVGQVDPGVLQSFLTKAEGSGLFEPGVDFGQPGITDQASTAVTLRAGAVPVTAAVYALGFEDPGAGGITEAQAQRRTDLIELTREARGLGDAARAWTPDRIRATAYPAPAGTPVPSSPSGQWPGPSFSEFPESGDGSLESCLVIEGDDAATVYAAALENDTTSFSDDGQVRLVVVAPLLPGQEGCPPS